MKPTVALGSDECYCGDYRSQHDPNGRCRVCGGMSGPYNGCATFRFARAANAEEMRHWIQYHGSGRVETIIRYKKQPPQPAR